jgi:energy-coupling factor transporter ATP-binding protein EcfA2
MYVPQIPYLFLTEESIEREVRELCNSRIREECFSRGFELLKRFGYDDLDRLPLHLSWGQVTRLVTLLSINAIGKVGLILLDEPFTGSTYFEAAALTETLSMFTDIAKIIVLSSKDYISLFPRARVYMLINGTLSPLAHRDAIMFSKTAYELMAP